MQLVNQDFEIIENGLFQQCKHLRADYRHHILFQVRMDYSLYFGGGEGRQTLEQKT